MDPLYQFSTSEIEKRIEQTAPTVAEQTRRNAGEFVWTHFATVDDLIAARMAAMSCFLADYDQGLTDQRYVAASLPNLPFESKTFQLAVCSHFLFLYSEQYDGAFHIQSILELTRVASEVRIFPLLELGTRPSRHLPMVMQYLVAQGLEVMRQQVPYEFQRGGNEMIRIVAS